jgi:hypothetical protein
MRGYFGLGQLSAAEKSDILDQHKSVYNGYQTMQPQVSNTQPLTVYDFAGDKEGLVVNNKGEVKKYTNMGINEQVETNKVCEQCGGTMKENVCEQCEESVYEDEEIDENWGTVARIAAPIAVNYLSSKMEEETGHLDDIYKVRDLNLKKGDYDYVEGGGNDYGTFEKAHHMKNIKNEQEDDDDFMDYESSYTQDGVDDTDNEDDGYEDMNASEVTDGEMDEIDVKDLIKGKKYRYKTPSHQDDIEFGDEYEYHDGKNMYGFKGGNTGYSLGKQSVEDFINNLDDEDEELYEQGYTGGGNAPDMDLSNIDPGYDFESDGPEQFQKSFDELEVEDEDEESEKPAFDFESGGPNSGYPVFEDDMYGYDPEKDYETMESAWADDELTEQPDISGAQGIYGAMKKAYDFDSEGPGKAGPYQEFSYESELDEEDDFEEVDEDIRESFLIQKNKINEMFNRFNKYN